MPNIKLQSSDGEIFDIDVEIAKCSGTIKTMLDCGIGDGVDGVVPLLNVNSAILQKILQWANHHKDDEQVPEDDPNTPKLTERWTPSEDISTWDSEFLKVDRRTLFQLVSAANFLDIKGLFDVTCKAVANMIKSKTAEEIRETFNIKNDLTPSEE